MKMKITEEEGLVILLAGIAVGLLAGLLWAPRSGRALRRDLRRGAQEGLGYLGEEAEKVRDGADRLAGSTKRWFDRVKTSVRAVKSRAEPSLEDPHTIT
jgi:gas vesicle protein